MPMVTWIRCQFSVLPMGNRCRQIDRHKYTETYRRTDIDIHHKDLDIKTYTYIHTQICTLK